ncbi:MAG: carboxypeptidase regulatory-like domain-containing protein, partial [Candidatus Eremiobacteraeota bacterium]|nr:carboxypeptidase regulatory-like domain-containing protein [Candidatus Eremiobacteraeota bacterium]
MVLCPRPAQAQSSLVVGSVRDRYGAAIEDATVTVLGSAGLPASASTDAAGTFAIQAAGAAAVRITCRFCAPLTVAVKPGEPVVAIVTRYDALFEAAPSDGDLANLPYAHVENAMALRPFTLLSQSTSPIPGPALSDRGLQPSNALLVDAGVPNYDSVLGVSPYATIPAAYESSGQVLPASGAFRYGDQAGSGIVTLTPLTGDDANVALIGTQTTARVAAGSAADGVVAGTFADWQESRQRADGILTLPLSNAQTIVVNGGTSQGRAFGSPPYAFAESFSFARAAFDDAQPSIDLSAQLIADRGNYGAVAYGSLDDVWSDVNFQAGARTRGEVAGFADISTRLSTGTYDASYEPKFGALVTQNRFDAGVDADLPWLDATGGVGFFGFGFSGGPVGSSGLSYGHLATPSLDATLFPAGKWSAEVSASGSYTLPTMWQQYGWDDNYASLTYDRASLYGATLTYTDQSRVRISAQAASQHVSGYTNGIVTSDGFSLAWQFAPALSLRAWTMFVDDATRPTAQAPGMPGIA